MAEAMGEIELTDGQIESANILADEIFYNLVDEIEGSGEDSGAIAYSLWIDLTHYLAMCGWTSQDLASDAAAHAAVENGLDNFVGCA